MKGITNYHNTLFNGGITNYESNGDFYRWNIGGGSYGLNNPLSVWFNGSTYVVGYENNVTYNQVIILKQTDFTIETSKVGNGTIGIEPENHPTPILIVTEDGYIYVIQNQFHVTPFRVWKSDAPEDISSFTYLGDFDTNGAYINLVKRDGKFCRFVTRSADASESPNYFYLSILEVDLDNPTEYSKFQLTDNNYTGTTVRHYLMSPLFYGESEYRVGGINHRFDPLLTNYKTSIWITKDFTTFDNFGQTFSKNVRDSGELSVSELETNFKFFGTDSNTSVYSISWFIQVNDDIYISRKVGSYVYIQKYTIGSTSLVAEFKIYQANVYNLIYLYYNGERIVINFATGDNFSNIQVGTIDTDLNPESYQYQTNLDNMVDIFYVGFPSNLNEVTGNYIIIGRSVVGDLGNVPYYITDNLWKDESTPVTTKITNLSLVTAYGSALKITWNDISGQDVAQYDIYVDDLPYATSTSTTTTITGLDLNTSYDIKVRPVYKASTNGTFSDTLTTSTAASYVIPTGNIISYWNFDSDSTDQVGSNNGSDTSISYVSGKVGNCADFTASTSSIIQVTDSDTLSFGNGSTDSPFSISVWVNFNSVGAALFVGKETTTREYDLLYNGTVLRWRLFGSGSLSHDIRIDYTWTPSTGVWYHVVGTYNGNGQNTDMKLYLNAVSVGSVASSGSYVAMTNTTNNLSFGKYIPSTVLSFNGYLDEPAIFDKELSALEVSEIYMKNNSGSALTA